MSEDLTESNKSFMEACEEIFRTSTGETKSDDTDLLQPPARKSHLEWCKTFDSNGLAHDMLVIIPNKCVKYENFKKVVDKEIRYPTFNPTLVELKAAKSQLSDGQLIDTTIISPITVPSSDEIAITQFTRPTEMVMDLETKSFINFDNLAILRINKRLAALVLNFSHEDQEKIFNEFKEVAPNKTNFTNGPLYEANVERYSMDKTIKIIQAMLKAGDLLQKIRKPFLQEFETVRRHHGKRLYMIRRKTIHRH